LKATISCRLSDPEGNEIGSLWIDGYDDDLIASVCLDDALLLHLGPFFGGVNWFVPPDGADGDSRAFSSAVNSLSSSAAEVPASKLKIGSAGPDKASNCDASYPVTYVLSIVVDSVAKVQAPKSKVH